MTPEEHKKLAEENRQKNPALGIYHAQMGILEALLQMEICGHGTRGFCINCLAVLIGTALQGPIRTRDWRD